MRSRRSRWSVALVLATATALGLAVCAAPASAERAHPCRLPGYSAVRFFAVSTAGASSQPQLSARDAKVFCGGPDDGHWYPIGPAHAVRLAPAADLTIKLFTRTSSGSFATGNVSLARLERFLTLTTHDPQFLWYGAGFGVKRNSAGAIDSITELFHP